MRYNVLARSPTTQAANDDARAVSPVVGTLLMVAIAVGLAALSTVLFLGLTDTQPPAPEVAFEVNASAGSVSLRHTHGDVLPREHIEVVVRTESAETRYRLDQSVDLDGQLGDGDDTVEAGEVARLEHSMTGTLDVIVIDTHSNTIIYETQVSVTPVNLDVITALDATAGATDVRHAAAVEVEGSIVGETLSEVTITYPAGTVDLSETANSESNFYVMGIDTDSDGTVEKDLSDDIQSMGLNNENEITVGVDSSYSLDEDDRILVKYKEVDNPSSTGTYDVEITVTTSAGSTRTVTGTLEITS